MVGRITAPKMVNNKRKYPKNIIEDVKCELGVDINYMKAWSSKEWAIEMVKGKPTCTCILVYVGFNLFYAYITMHKSSQMSSCISSKHNIH